MHVVAPSLWGTWQKCGLPLDPVSLSVFLLLKHVTQFKTDVWDPPRACHNPGTLNISVQVRINRTGYTPVASHDPNRANCVPFYNLYMNFVIALRDIVCVQLHLRDPLDAVKYLRKEITLRKCWSTMGNRSHEVCGPKSKLVG